jgi:hypothetical protein
MHDIGTGGIENLLGRFVRRRILVCTRLIVGYGGQYSRCRVQAPNGRLSGDRILKFARFIMPSRRPDTCAPIE